MDYTQYLRERAAEGGFVTDATLPLIVKHDRLRTLLVRCGGKRFLAPAQDIAGLIHDVEAGGDYVRDVSFPASDPIFRGDYSFPSDPYIRRPYVDQPAKPTASGFPRSCYVGRSCVDSYGFDGPSDADPGL